MGRRLARGLWCDQEGGRPPRPGPLWSGPVQSGPVWSSLRGHFLFLGFCRSRQEALWVQEGAWGLPGQCQRGHGLPAIGPLSPAVATGWGGRVATRGKPRVRGLALQGLGTIPKEALSWAEWGSVFRDGVPGKPPSPQPELRGSLLDSLAGVHASAGSGQSQGRGPMPSNPLSQDLELSLGSWRHSLAAASRCRGAFHLSGPRAELEHWPLPTLCGVQRGGLGEG